MGRSKKLEDEDIKEIKELKKERKKEFVDFDKALLLYLRLKPYRKLGFNDKEAVRIAMKKRIPTLRETIEEWKKQFDKF